MVKQTGVFEAAACCLGPQARIALGCLTLGQRGRLCGRCCGCGRRRGGSCGSCDGCRLLLLSEETHELCPQLLLAGRRLVLWRNASGASQDGRLEPTTRARLAGRGARLVVLRRAGVGRSRCLRRGRRRRWWFRWRSGRNRSWRRWLLLAEYAHVRHSKVCLVPSAALSR